MQNIRIQGWECKGMRVPDHEISFLKNPDSVEKECYRTSFLQAPNGTG